MQQTDGVSMGNPLAPTMANFFLGSLECELWNTKPRQSFPAFYTRYVDDVFCVFRKGTDFHVFLKVLNSLHSNLKFTYELGGASLPFLDMKIEFKEAKLSTTIHPKKTDTGSL